MPISKESDLQQWARSILNTPAAERAVMVAEDPSVFDVLKRAYDELAQRPPASTQGTQLRQLAQRLENNSWSENSAVFHEASVMVDAAADACDRWESIAKQFDADNTKLRELLATAREGLQAWEEWYNAGNCHGDTGWGLANTCGKARAAIAAIDNAVKPVA